MGQTVFPRSDYSSKADKVTSATNGNFAGLDSNGNLTDSGHKHSDYATATEMANEKAATAIVEDGNTASQAISAGEFVLWIGDLYTADSNIASGATLASSGGSKNLTAVSGGGLNALNGKIANIGTIVNGTNASSLVVPAATYTTVNTLSLTAGKWLVIGANQWSESFDNICITKMSYGASDVAGTVVRYSAQAGGGANISAIVSSSSSFNLHLMVYQSSAQSKTASVVVFKAIQIA